MSAKRPVSGLGRGLSALIDESAPPAAEAEGPGESRGGVRTIEVGRIRPNPNQPRMHFSEESIDELADSIGERGVLQPILLRPHGDGYEIIAGERRWRASKVAKRETIPAIVERFDDATALEIALIENLQREDLSPLDEAFIYSKMTSEL
ncbi:MAG TPA: ParB/RepB/Spo0J family partition protein, partial [Sphingomicrobium sp.]|nr:ParB/RepB/Spo0J family partition protein [Sphingomicrobium sp.]